MLYILCPLIILLILFILYVSGFIALQQKRAVMFVASVNGAKARFSSCTGKITRIVWFREKREYRILFEKTIDKGSVDISLYDREGNSLIHGGKDEAYAFSPEPGKRYRLCIQMQKASGKYQIRIV